MKEVHVGSFAELHEGLESCRPREARWVFRGQADAEWRLLPRAGRIKFPGRMDDASWLRAWKRRALEHITMALADDWDWLSVAQHHGLATRLLDWTFNPLAAAFFAVREARGVDAALVAYRVKREIDTKTDSPFEFERVAFFRPRGIAQRIIRQAGAFTVHGPPSLCLDADTIWPGEELVRFVIPAKHQRQLRLDLDYYGVNVATLFPDLDGLADYANWLMADPHGSASLLD